MEYFRFFSFHDRKILSERLQQKRPGITQRAHIHQLKQTNDTDTRPIPPIKRRMAYVFRKRNLGTVDIPGSAISAKILLLRGGYRLIERVHNLLCLRLIGGRKKN